MNDIITAIAATLNIATTQLIDLYMAAEVRVTKGETTYVHKCACDNFDDIMYMWQEERVLLAPSEEPHTNAVASLIRQYGIEAEYEYCGKNDVYQYQGQKKTHWQLAISRAA